MLAIVKIVKQIMKDNRRPPWSLMLATIAGAMAWQILYVPVNSYFMTGLIGETVRTYM